MKNAKKTLIAAILLLVMSHSFIVPALATSTVPRMQSSVNTSMYTRRMSISQGNSLESSINAIAVYVLQPSGELWAYFAGNPRTPSELGSRLVLSDVIAISTCSARGFNFNATASTLESSIFPALALRSDGTVWITLMGLKRGNYELYTNAVKLDSSVSKISCNYYLKNNGDLYSVRTNGQHSLITAGSSVFDRGTVSTELILRNISDTSNGNHLSNNRNINMSGTNLSGVQQLFYGSGANFALTTDGNLYGWGVHTTGRIGVGTNFDGATGVSGRWNLFVERPRFVMGNVSTMYFDDERVYARDTGGRLWTWGGPESATVGAGNVVTWGNERYLRPRLAGYDQPRYSRINGVSIRPDGTLFVQSFDITNNRTHDVVLPVRFGDVMGGGGAIQPQPPGQPSVQPPTQQPQPPGQTPVQPPTQQPQPPVQNQPAAWAAEPVNRAIALGLVPQDLRSRYNQPITRAEFTALAVALYETVTGRVITERMMFNDTTDINVQKMGGLNVVSGVGNGNFAPNDTLTREQAATMLSRLAFAAGNMFFYSHPPTFADNAQISAWAFDSVGQVQHAGIMGGVGQNMFSPRGAYTREQSIVTMLRLHELITPEACCS